MIILKNWTLKLSAKICFMQSNIFFYFHDKPGKQLAQDSPTLQQTSLIIKKANEEPTRDIQENLQIFFDYYSELHALDTGRVLFRAFESLPQLSEE